MPVQNKPIIHGRDHETDGADPIRGLLPPTSVAGDYPAAIRGLDDLRGYWRLGEGSSPFADTSGYSALYPAHMTRNLGTTGSPDMTENVTPGLLHEAHDDGAVAFNAAGDDSGLGVKEHLEADVPASDPNFSFDSTHPTMSVIARVKPTEGAAGFWGAVVSFWNEVSKRGWMLQVRFPTGEVEFVRSTTGSAGGALAATTPPLAATGETHSLAATYDGSLIRVYHNGVLAGSLADTADLPAAAEASAYALHIGGNAWPFPSSGYWRPFYGVIDEVAVFGSVLTDADIAALHQLAETGEVPEGYVPIIGDDGEPIWAPPGTEVEHPGDEEEENPTTGPGSTYTGTPTDGSGWHTDAHFEYVVLYDSSPGRFDVPSRKWVRVPFNTVRIQRRWELEVDGEWRDAWLPDDRGLTEHAKQGVLLVTPGMTFGSDEQEISGWYSIEYPMLASSGLPNPGGGSPDRYVRAARMTNTTNGQVLRVGGSVDLSYRNFFEWPFSSPADGDEGRIYFQADNPYPLYPNSPGRPLNKPLPYPKKTNADSLDDYKSLSTGAPGFDLGYFTSILNLDAGAAISLQAWQDSPWTLRFGTDKYPPFTPFNYVETWRKRPALVLYHRYDPDTVDHDTGALL